MYQTFYMGKDLGNASSPNAEVEQQSELRQRAICENLVTSLKEKVSSNSDNT